jgi:hypothetical protein
MRIKVVCLFQRFGLDRLVRSPLGVAAVVLGDDRQIEALALPMN